MRRIDWITVGGWTILAVLTSLVWWGLLVAARAVVGQR